MDYLVFLVLVIWFLIISYAAEAQVKFIESSFTNCWLRKIVSMSHSPNVLAAKSLQQKNKRLVFHAPATKISHFSLSLRKSKGKPDKLLFGDSSISIDIEGLEELPGTEQRVKLGAVTFRIANLVFSLPLVISSIMRHLISWEKQ